MPFHKPTEVSRQFPQITPKIIDPILKKSKKLTLLDPITELTEFGQFIDNVLLKQSAAGCRASHDLLLFAQHSHHPFAWIESHATNEGVPRGASECPASGSLTPPS